LFLYSPIQGSVRDILGFDGVEAQKEKDNSKSRLSLVSWAEDPEVGDFIKDVVEMGKDRENDAEQVKDICRKIDEPAETIIQFLKHLSRSHGDPRQEWERILNEGTKRRRPRGERVKNEKHGCGD